MAQAGRVQESDDAAQRALKSLAAPCRMPWMTSLANRGGVYLRKLSLGSVRRAGSASATSSQSISSRAALRVAVVASSTRFSSKPWGVSESRHGAVTNRM
jgi:hypothetical protein